MFGNGYVSETMKREEAISLVRSALEGGDYSGRRILLILPDATRSAPVGLLYKCIYDELSNTAACIDGLIALGTHQPMEWDAILKRVGITDEEYRQRYSALSRFYNHAWDDPEALVEIGTIGAGEISSITRGYMQRPVTVTVNRMILDYDVLFVLGPVFPHEIVGFSGGNKYFFPGICGEDILNTFHWLGGMITNAKINGTRDTPVRELINRSAGFIPVSRLYFHMVVRHGNLHGLFIGDGITSWGMAADLSAEVNVEYTGRSYKTVIGLAPEKYDELWTGAKVAYKAETIVEDGGSLIIYAPHISEISYTHGQSIRKVGYHVRDYFSTRMDAFHDISGGVLSHIVAVKGSGSFEHGIEKPRIEVFLATSIPEAVCRAVNLGYVDYRLLNIDELREQEDVLVIDDAGEVLFKRQNEQEEAVKQSV